MRCSACRWPIQLLPLDAARHLLGLLAPRERKALGQTCRLFDAAVRSLRREAAGAISPTLAAAAAAAAMLARHPGLSKLFVIVGESPTGEPESLRAMAAAAARVRSLRVLGETAFVFDHIRAARRAAFPALAELSLSLDGLSSAPGAPDLAALRALRELTALTLLNAASDAGLSKVTRLRRLAIHLPDHDDVPRECEDCGDIHEEDLFALAEEVNAEEPVQIGRALRRLPRLEHLAVHFSGGDRMAGFNAARNCFLLPNAKPGVFPALRELELRDVGDGTTFAEAAPSSAALWRKSSGAYFFVVAPRLERVRRTWFDEEGDERFRRQLGVARAVRRDFSGDPRVRVDARVIEYVRRVTLDEARGEWAVSLERAGAPAP